MGKKTSRTQFGNLVSLKRISTNNTTIDQSDNNDYDDDFLTYKTMKISYNIYEKLRDHSHKYHDQPISYDEIIDELCTFYNEEHERKYF